MNIKNSSLKNLIILLAIFSIIFTIFSAYTSRSLNNFDLIENFDSIKNSDSNIQKTYTRKNPTNIKQDFSQSLIKKEKYERSLNRTCEVTGSLHDRHKVRWVINKALLTTYNFFYDIKPSLPYYFHIFLYSFLIFLSFFFLKKTIKMNTEQIIFFLFFIAFIFGQRLGEFHYSVVEMFCFSMALYASQKKYIYLFILSIILATLNRESGILIAFSWLIFNKDYQKAILTFLVSLALLILLNLDILECIVNPRFFIPLGYQHGQFNIRDLYEPNYHGYKTGYLSFIKILTLNFFIPFGFSFYLYFTNTDKNKFVLYLLLIYLVVFLIALPLHHYAARLILLPLIIILMSFKSENTFLKTKQ